MTYQKFLEEIAASHGGGVEYARTFMLSLAKVLGTLEVGDSILTPIGTFRTMVRKGRDVKVPKSTMVVRIPPMQVLKFKAHSRLKHDIKQR